VRDLVRRFAAGGHLIFFDALFLLHSTVLEPDLHLRFVQTEGSRDFDASGSRQVFVEVKFLLQFRQLFIRKVRST